MAPPAAPAAAERPGDPPAAAERSPAAPPGHQVDSRLAESLPGRHPRIPGAAAPPGLALLAVVWEKSG